MTLVNHGLPPNLTESAWGESAKFFELPPEAKRACAFGSAEANRGYLGVGDEKADFRVPDLRETFSTTSTTTRGQATLCYPVSSRWC